MLNDIRFSIFALICVSTPCCGGTVIIGDAQLSLIDAVEVPCQDAGVVQTLSIKPGDYVVKEDVVAELDKAKQLNMANGAEIQLEIAEETIRNDVNIRFAEKSAAVAANHLKRSRTAIAAYHGSVSATEQERRELEHEQAILSGEQAQHNMLIDALTAKLRQSEFAQAQIQLRQRTVRSPIDGVVSEVFVQSGEWVHAGSSVARIVNLDRLRIVALVPVDHLLDIKVGQPAKFSLLLANVPIAAHGEVTFVSPEINPVNREFVIWIDIDNRQGDLRPGLVGTLELRTSAH